MFYIYHSYSIFEIQNTGETNTDQVQFVCAVWLKSCLEGVVRKPNLAENSKKKMKSDDTNRSKTENYDNVVVKVQ